MGVQAQKRQTRWKKGPWKTNSHPMKPFNTNGHPMETSTIPWIPFKTNAIPWKPFNTNGHPMETFQNQQPSHGNCSIQTTVPWTPLNTRDHPIQTFQHERPSHGNLSILATIPRIRETGPCSQVSHNQNPGKRRLVRDDPPKIALDIRLSSLHVSGSTILPGFEQVTHLPANRPIDLTLGFPNFLVDVASPQKVGLTSPRWIDDFIALASLPSSLFVSNNPLHSEQVAWQSGVRLPVLRPVVLYLKESRLFFFCFGGTPPKCCFLFVAVSPCVFFEGPPFNMAVSNPCGLPFSRQGQKGVASKETDPKERY